MQGRRSAADEQTAHKLDTNFRDWRGKLEPLFVAKRRAKTGECEWKDWESCVGANLLMSFLCPFASIREADSLLIRRRRRRIHHQRRREETTSLRDNLSGTTASSKINKYKRLNRAGSGCAGALRVDTAAGFDWISTTAAGLGIRLERPVRKFD